MTTQILGVDGGTITLIVCVVALGGASLVATRRMRRRSARSPAARWPQVSGTVVSASVQVSHNGTGRHETPIVLYRYRVGAQEFQGNRVRLKRDGGRACDTVARYPAGSCVPVFYDPRNPAESALER